MLIVFVIAALAVLVVVAYLATGRGGGLGPLPDEVNDFRLPQPPLRPADLNEIHLGKTVRGYRVDHVDQLIDRLAIELATRDDRIAELQQKLAIDGIHRIAKGATPVQGRRPDSEPDVPRPEAEHGPSGAMPERAAPSPVAKHAAPRPASEHAVPGPEAGPAADRMASERNSADDSQPRASPSDSTPQLDRGSGPSASGNDG